MKDIFLTIANVVLMIASNDSCLNFYTHQYSGKNPLKTVHFGRGCNINEIRALNIYPDKFTDMMERDLNLATFEYLPYVNIKSKDGAELSMINSFAEKYNYTLRLNTYVESWGSIEDKFNGTQALGNVAAGNSDIGIACFYPMIKRQFALDFSIATMRNALTFLVPQPQLSAGITTPLKPFQVAPWFIILLTLFTFVSSYTMANKLYKKYNGTFLFMRFLFEMFGVLLQQNMNLRIRCLGILCLSWAFLMSAFYNSVLSSYMTKPTYDKYIHNGRDLNESKLKIVAMSDSYISGLNVNVYGNIIHNFRITPIEDLHNLLKTTTNIAIGIDHLDLGYSLSDYESILNLETLEQFILLEEDLSHDSCTVIGYKHSVIMPVLNAHILRLKESGLDYYWQAESFRKLDYKKTIYLNLRNTLDSQFIQLRIKHISGALILLACGYFFATLQFLDETYKSKRSQSHKNRKYTQK